MQMKKYPVLKKYVEQLSRQYFRKAVPVSVGKISKEWKERAATAGKPRQETCVAFAVTTDDEGCLLVSKEG